MKMKMLTGNVIPLVLPERSKRQLDRLVELLTDPDDDRRRAHVGRVMAVTLPAVLGLLIDRLVGVLKGGRKAARRRAAASLAEMGEAALGPLVHHLQTTRSKHLQARLPGVLVRIGRALSAARRTELQFDLGIAMRRARDRDAAAVMLWAIRQLRPWQSSQEAAGIAEAALSGGSRWPRSPAAG
jgi:hypothetical protein